ncbi:helix-turn-helix domain-containing protein [Streptomyces sp. N2-109]|uniref:Helix-turn-helix domain-containing protein n=1 Tax=Streptomyces gossypii TaxID=2883101 RepID=A0ABT2JWW3_9ACTN|nr:helix-turn-helix domain-containing protein [Streptomyces gossypii]MCT2592394.1 helix-turn-helix domain-containing protein [Streptomyces gossypii]
MYTTTLRVPEMTHPQGLLPPEFATIMRPELPSLIREVTAEIGRSVPEYAEVMAGPYARAVQHLVDQSLSTFVEKVGDPRFSTSQRDKLIRRFGRFEAYENRSLDTMQASLRIGARLALHRAKTVGKRYNLSPALLMTFADALFAYLDDLVQIAREGYLQARAEMDQGQDSRRRLLLQLILSGSATSYKALADAADRTNWPLPDEVTLLAVSPEAKPDRGALSADILTDFEDPQPHLLIPGRIDDERRQVIATAPGHLRAAVGLTVPLGQAAESLRWARRALALVENGVIAEAPVTYCEDHLVTLWLFADPELLEKLAERQLAPLAEFTPNQRERLIDTLRAWMDTRGNAVQMAEILHLHPQTVRYRLRNLDRAFGSQLTEPDPRFALELVLRALQLRGQTAAAPPDRPRAQGRGLL